MTQVKIKNFQSIGDISFSVEGLTVIVGKGNIGKSAIVRAMNAALTNQSGKEHIKIGHKKAEVHIKHGDLNIQWSRSDTVSYKINDSAYSSLNKAVPDPILKAGFRDIQVGDVKLNPLMAGQFNPLFLLDEKGSIITDAIATLYGLNILNDADDLCLKELRSKKSLTKTRDKDLLKVSERIEQFKDLEDIKKEASKIFDLEKTCVQLKNKIVEVDSYIKKLELITTKVKALKPVQGLKIPDYKKLEKTEKESVWVAGAIKSCEISAIKIAKLEGASKALIPDTLDLKKRIENFQRISTWLNSVMSFAGTLKRQRDIFELLKEKMSGIVALSTSLIGVSEKLRYAAIAHDSLVAMIKTTKEQKAEFEKLTLKIKEAEAEKSKYSSCPLCKRPL